MTPSERASTPANDSPYWQGINRLVADWPPLTEEQRAKLRALLMPAGAA